MELVKYIVLGLIQGIAEVLPISSSAHLLIAQYFFKMEDGSITFEVFLHLASLIAIMIYLWPKFWKLVKGFCLYVFKRNKDYILEFKYCLFIVISTIPTVIFTLILNQFGLIDKISSTIWFVGVLLMINAVLLFVLPKIKGTRKEKDMNWLDAVVIGCFQCAGIFPGISRSGSCLCGAFSRKIDKETATDYAFIMFIPAVVGATVLEVVKYEYESLPSQTIGLYIVSFIIAGIVTYFAFKLLLSVIRKGKISWFSYYCFGVGLTVTLLDIFNVIK